MIKVIEPDDDRLLMPDGHYHFGVTNFKEKEIYIANNLKDETMTNTLIHELTHAFIDSYGLLQVEWNDEIVADFVATYLENFVNILESISDNMQKEGKTYARTGLGEDRGGSEENKV